MIHARTFVCIASAAALATGLSASFATQSAPATAPPATKDAPSKTLPTKAPPPAAPGKSAPPAGAPGTPGTPSLAPPKPAASAPKITPQQSTDKVPTAEEVFKKHIEATGGLDAWKAKKSMNSTGVMRFPSAGLEGKMVVKAMLPNQMLMTMDITGIGVVSAGFDGTTGWSINPMAGPTILEGKPLDDMRRQADFQRDLLLAGNPGKSEVKGPALFGVTEVWNVTVREADGRETTNLYDRKTGMLVGTIMNVASQMGEVPVTVVMSQYNDFDGVKWPKLALSWTPVGQQEIITDTIEWNTVPAAEFALPPEIVALQSRKKSPTGPGGAPAGPGGKPTGPSTKPAGPGGPAPKDPPATPPQGK